MLDIRFVRAHPEIVKADLQKRNDTEKIGWVDDLLNKDARSRELKVETDTLRQRRNTIARDINAAKKAGQDAKDLMAEAAALPQKIRACDAEQEEIRTATHNYLMRLPNILHDSVPVGKDDSENVEIKRVGTPRVFDFEVKNHGQLAADNNWADFERATKLSGSGFVLYTNWGAKLERALIQFMLDLHTSAHGYTEVSPPYMVGPQCLEGVGQFPKFADQYYGVQEGLDAGTLGKLYLIPTAETPVANIHREEILKESALPLRYCAYTPCFRGEAGAAGVGTRGMIRVHQFDKVELISIVKPENGYTEHEQMVAGAERVLQSLGLHYRVVLLCTGDMGFASAKTYDLEVWAPGQGSYLEVSSVSNCEDFQARRMNLRFKAETGDNRFPHVLNGSGTALARLFVALVETYQQADGTLAVPAALQPYLKTERITT